MRHRVRLESSFWFL